MPRTSPSRRRVGRFWICGVLSILLPPASLEAQKPAASEEYELKAAFVYKFPQFVEWPASSLAGRTSIELCVVRPNLFGPTLEDLVAGETLGGLPILVREIDLDGSIDACHVLFVPRTVAAGVSDLMSRASMRSILTIGETSRFLDDGGVIRLHIVERRVRFDISTAAAERVGLRLSSQLLRLAVEVRMALP